MRHAMIEPGIVPLFRLFAIGRFVLVGALAAAWALAGRGPISPSGWAELGAAGLLLGYLTWPGLPERLGRVFLPLALVVAAVAPIVLQPGMFRAWTADIAANDYGLISVVQPIPSLLVLTTIIAWQYDLSRLWLFSFGVAALDIIWFVWFTPIERAAWFLFAGMLLLRIIVLPMVGYMVVRMMAAQRAQRLYDFIRDRLPHAPALRKVLYDFWEALGAGAPVFGRAVCRQGSLGECAVRLPHAPAAAGPASAIIPAPA